MQVTVDSIKQIMPKAPTANATAMANAINKYGAEMGINTTNALAIFLGNVAHESDQLRAMKEGGTMAYLKSKWYYPFIGAGPLQVSTERNYRAVSMKIYGDDRLVKNPSLIYSDLNALMFASLWWWNINKNSLNKYADAGNGRAVSNYINRGSVLKTALHLVERLNFINIAMSILKKKI